MNELKEILESIGARIRSPFFGYFFFAVILMNWQALFFLFFSDVDILARFSYFNEHTTWCSKLWWPLLIGIGLALISPWTRWLFTLAAEIPTTRRRVVQLTSEHAVLNAKSKMASLISEIQTSKEDDLIFEAKRDLAVSQIENVKIRDKLQFQIDELRNAMPNKVDVDGMAIPSTMLRLELVRDGSSFRFVLANIGESTAKNINFNLILDVGQENPIPQSELDKFPVPMLSAGGSLSLIAALDMGSETAYDAMVSWENPDGHSVSERLYASL